MPPELSPWLQYGVLGLVLIAILAGQLITKGHAEEIRGQRNDAITGWKDATGAVRDLTTVNSRMLDRLEELLHRERAG